MIVTTASKCYWGFKLEHAHEGFSVSHPQYSTLMEQRCDTLKSIWNSIRGKSLLSDLHCSKLQAALIRLPMIHDTSCYKH